MLLKITHQTDLQYEDLICESAMELRMSPRQEEDQHRLSFALAVGPAAPVSSYFDWLGNTVHTLTINPFHKQMRVVATSVVQSTRKVPELETLPDIWPITPEKLDYAMFDYLQHTGPIVDCSELRDFAGSVAARRDERLGAVAGRILHLVHDKFTYQKGVTTAASPITEILRHGRGVCQDFTHLMIGLSRTLGIPARYVSGFVHRGNQAVRGDAQTHAWCELFFPSKGWIGFDPTNNCLAGANFIRVAYGRDFRDVPPNRGVYRGQAAETISVAVQIKELAHIPPALAAERVEPINFDVYPFGKEEHLEAVSHQQEQQQQQLRQQQEQQQQQQ